MKICFPRNICIFKGYKTEKIYRLSLSFLLSVGFRLHKPNLVYAKMSGYMTRKCNVRHANSMPKKFNDIVFTLLPNEHR